MIQSHPPVHRRSMIFSPGTLCGQACANQVKFDPFKSSTFVDGGAQFGISFITGVGVDPVVDEDYTLILRNGTDTVSVGGLTVANTSLFLITNQTAKFSRDTFSGILGNLKQRHDYKKSERLLGMGANNATGLFGALIKQGLPCKKISSCLGAFQKKTQLQLIALFSLYLTPKSVGNAELTIGGIDESKFHGEIARTLECYKIKC